MVTKEVALDKVQTVCELFYETYYVPLCMFNQTLDIELLLSEKDYFPPHFSNGPELLLSSIMPDPSPLPINIVSHDLLNYITITVDRENYIILGPVLFFPLSEENIVEFMNKRFIPSRKKQAYFDYFQNVRIMPNKMFQKMGSMLYYLIHQKKVSFPINEQTEEKHRQYKGIEQELELYLLSQRDTNKLNNNILYEKQLLQCIEDGRQEHLLTYFESLDSFRILAKGSQLRNEQNKAICLITLASRAAIAGGLQPEVASSLSDLYIQNLENISAIENVKQLCFQCLEDLTSRVYKRKNHKYSRHVNACKQYIFHHLYDEINLNRLSKATDMNGDYLSRLFKQETGTSINNYVQKERIEEAKKLMALTKLSLTEISVKLQFNDQSYFTKVFKKLTGLTPKQYKDSI